MIAPLDRGTSNHSLEVLEVVLILLTMLLVLTPLTAVGLMFFKSSVLSTIAILTMSCLFSLSSILMAIAYPEMKELGDELPLMSKLLFENVLAIIYFLQGLLLSGMISYFKVKRPLSAILGCAWLGMMSILTVMSFSPILKVFELVRG